MTETLLSLVSNSRTYTYKSTIIYDISTSSLKLLEKEEMNMQSFYTPYNINKSYN